MEAVPYLTHKWNSAVATVDKVLFDIAVVADLVAGIVAEFYKRIKVGGIGFIFLGEPDLVSAQISDIEQSDLFTHTFGKTRFGDFEFTAFPKL